MESALDCTLAAPSSVSFQFCFLYALLQPDGPSLGHNMTVGHSLPSSEVMSGQNSSPNIITNHQIVRHKNRIGMIR